jgi:hypothetical protein
VYGDALQSVAQDFLLLMNRLFIEPFQKGPDDPDGIVQFDYRVLESSYRRDKAVTSKEIE